MKLQYFDDVERADNLCTASLPGYINGISTKKTNGLMTIKDWTLPHYRLSTFGRRAFSLAGLVTWNSLPDSLCDPALNSDSFRRMPKMQSLFTVYATHTAQ